MASIVKQSAPIPRWFWFVSLLGCTPGFKGARCKKLLKVTMSRVKLLKGRREVQVRQLRRDVAQLLQLGQVENAESRLDRLWKEQSLLSAYIKTGEYCQLLKANIINIALPRECPVDLKEPIASLCFAASYCADLPELQELRELMVSKYGRDFLHSGNRLIPGKHVNKMYLEALATKEHSEQSKTSLLKGILTEYNIVLPEKPKRPSTHDLQLLKDAKGPCTDCDQHWSSPALSQALNGVVKDPEQHKQGQRSLCDGMEDRTPKTRFNPFLRKSSQVKCSKGKSKSRNHKSITSNNQVGEREHHVSRKGKRNNKVTVSDCPFVAERDVNLPEQFNSKGHSISGATVLEEVVRQGSQVVNAVTGQHKCNKAAALRDPYRQIHAVENSTFGKEAFAEWHKPKASAEESCKAQSLEKDKDMFYDDQTFVEGDVFCRSNGYSRSKRVMHDFEKRQQRQGLQCSDWECVNTSCGKRHSRRKRRLRPIDEHDKHIQKMSAFGGHPTQNEKLGPNYELENQQPSWRDCGPSPKNDNWQERNKSSKSSIHDQKVENNALSRPYSEAPMPQKVKKEPINNSSCPDIYQEIEMDFKEVLHNQASKVSSPLNKFKENNNHQLIDTQGHTSANLKTQYPSWRDDPMLEHNYWQAKRQTSKENFHDKRTESEALAKAYINAPVPQNTKKKSISKHFSADIQQDIETNFKELLHSRAFKISPCLDKCDKTYNHQLTDTPRHSSENLHEKQNHVTEGGVQLSINGTTLQKPAVEHFVGEQLDPVNFSISTKRGYSQRTRKQNFNQLNSRTKLLEKISANKEPLEEAFAGDYSNGKVTMPPMVVMAFTESAQKKKGQLLATLACKDLGEKDLDVIKVTNGHEIDSVGNFDTQPANTEDKKAPELKQKSCWNSEKVSPLSFMFSKQPDDLLPTLGGAVEFDRESGNQEEDGRVELKQKSRDLESCSPLPFQFSKPPNRPPPPVPPCRVISMPSRQPCSSPPILPQRSVTFEAGHIRGVQEAHVHRKLPDYEDLVASFSALKKKPSQPPTDSLSASN